LLERLCQLHNFQFQGNCETKFEIISIVTMVMAKHIQDAKGGILFVDEAYRLICMKMKSPSESSLLYGFKLHPSCSIEVIGELHH
jgi:hypothetical protein